MEVAYISDVGKKRSNNEDSILVDKEKRIFLLADGMGGHQAGEVASDIAVKEIYDYLRNKVDTMDGVTGTFELLTAALNKAHDAIKEKANNNPNLKGMGTTLVGMFARNNKAYICHVGDSRAYLLREGTRQLTRDQTLGDYLVEKKIMSREEVPTQKWHTLTQAVGITEHIVPELNEVELKPGDIVLLCSDGLTDVLIDREIDGIVQDYRDNLERATTSLVDAANNKGGKDNISVVLVKYE